MTSKKLMRTILLPLTKFLFRFARLKCIQSANTKVEIFRSLMYSHGFRSFGQQSIIHFPISLRGAESISIGSGVGIGSNGSILAWSKYKSDTFTPEIIIGNHVWIGEFSHITCINKIEIGDDVLIGKFVTITDNGHGNAEPSELQIIPQNRSLKSKGPVSVGDKVWIGDKVTILPGVRIGNNSIIGANSVVTTDIPENCVAAGIPAKIIKDFRKSR